MCCQIITNIRFTDDKVFVTHADKDALPREFYESEIRFLSETLNTEGYKAAVAEILYLFLCGEWVCRIRHYCRIMGYIRFKEKIAPVEKVQECHRQTYTLWVKQRLAAYVFYRPHPCKCHIENLLGNKVAVMKRKKLMFGFPYRVFPSIDDAEVCILRSEFSRAAFVVVPENKPLKSINYENQDSEIRRLSAS